MKIRLSKILLICSAALFFGFTFTALAQNIPSISFPIAALGDCTDQASCRAYCDVPEHQSACTAFAEKNHIRAISPERQKKLTTITTDGGPDGSCGFSENPLENCALFCNSAENTITCVDYGESRGLLNGEKLNEAQKVRDALRRGINLPQGCTDVSSCRSICEHPTRIETIQSCFDFAEAAGILPKSLTREKAEYVLNLITQGSTFFKSIKALEECSKPKDETTLERCIAFGLESKILTPREAEVIKNSKGKGPGNCTTRKSCETYCAKEEHQVECYRFAITHDLLSDTERANLQESGRLIKEKLEHAPPELSKCLKSVVGSELLEKIIQGKEIPSLAMGESMKTCFSEQAIQPTLSLPPFIASCLEERGMLEQFEIHSGPLTVDMRKALESCSPTHTQTKNNQSIETINKEAVPQTLPRKKLEEKFDDYDIYKPKNNEDILQLKFKCSALGGYLENDACFIRKTTQPVSIFPSLQEFLGNFIQFIK